MEAPRQPLEFPDHWESVRSFVLAHDPNAALAISSQTPDWLTVPATERQVLLAAAASGVDPGIPSVRRELLARVRAVLASDGTTVPKGEPSVDEYRKVGSPEFAALVASAPNAAAAVDAVRKVVKGLEFVRAAQYLALLGYPVLAPSKARQRWLERMGLVGPSGPGAGNQRAISGVLADLAARVQARPQEFGAILDSFTNRERGGPCDRRPACPECVLRRVCPTAHAAGERDSSRAMTLAEAMPSGDRPREKLKSRGAEALTDAELVAILIRTGSGKENAVALANRLMREYGSLDRLARASTAELASRRGIGEVKAITIHAAIALARRLDAVEPGSRVSVHSSADAFQFLRKRFLGVMREEFVVLHLNSKNIITRVLSVTEGILNQSLVHPREAFAEAIRDSAAAVIFAHNHPSGDPTPSRDDIAITERLVKAGEVLGIRVLDHVIVGASEYYSFADDGRIKGKT